MRWQIEINDFVAGNEWRKYKTYDYYISAWFNALRGRLWTNFKLWLNNSNHRIKTRIVEVEE